MESFKISTRSKTELIEITGQVQRVVSSSGVREGVCHVFIPHTTAGVTVNESADPSVRKDLIMALNRVIPLNDAYAHMEGNAPAHIKASMVGSSVTIPVSEGAIALGTWQGIFFCEFDGPRTRSVWVTLAGK
ncbi:MAG: YjbQ family protein [Spirochaetes bacterium]|nr:MAG: YjbQ family protein [Spirochaetota bacterium]